MPVITVDLWAGRSPDQKRKLIEAFTKAMVDIAGSSPEHLHIIFHDVPKESWGRNGRLATELESESKPGN